MELIKKFDKNIVYVVKDQLKEELIEVGDKMGLDIVIRNGKFTDTQLSLKIDLRVLNDSGEAVLQMAEDFKQYAEMYGLQPSDLGKKVTYNGAKHEIVGLKPKNRKYPIIVKNLENGTKYKITAREIKLYLNENRS